MDVPGDPFAVMWSQGAQTMLDSHCINCHPCITSLITSRCMCCYLHFLRLHVAAAALYRGVVRQENLSKSHSNVLAFQSPVTSSIPRRVEQLPKSSCPCLGSCERWLVISHRQLPEARSIGT